MGMTALCFLHMEPRKKNENPKYDKDLLLKETKKK